MRIQHLGPGGYWLRYIVLTQMLLSASVALASDIRPSCELAKESILARTTSGLLQVSNLGDIRITCRVPQRPFPTKPGEFRNGLRAETTAYEILANGTKKQVPSEVNVIGGGFGPDPEPEWVDFFVSIPLDSEQLDTEVRRCLANLERSMTPEEKGRTEEIRKRIQIESPETLRQLIHQHRIGRFQIECRVLDGTRVMGVDVVDLEVLFEGNQCDLGFPASPPA